MTGPQVRRLAIAAAIAVALVAPFLLPTYLLTLLSLVFIAALLASSVDLLAGQGGLVSIGHAGIAASAAYAIAIAGFVTSAFVYPAPLPTAHVVSDGDVAPITGDLVVEDGGVWYVADFHTDEIQGLNLLNTDEASFQSRDRDARPTVLGVFD